MKRAALAVLVIGLLWISAGTRVVGQNLLSEGAIASLEVSMPDPADGQTDYADGVRAINNGRWSEAVAIFSRVAGQGGDHADGALFWKAYAENKLGQSSQALSDCGMLRSLHGGSKWTDECGALEIEIRGKAGKPLQPQAQPTDDLKLLALATMMQHDEKRALEQIDEILNSDAASEKLKQGALFIMGEHHSNTVYPQIARISFVEGDVRIARGDTRKHDKNAGWRKAVAELPLETGDSLVTGNGRAEIELEDASTLYLGENSVLSLNDLHTAGGVPYTEAALLTGTVTLHVKPYVAGEEFVLRMPTDTLLTRYPQAANVRVSSYTDGVAITTLGSGNVWIEGANRQTLALNQTYYFKNGKRTIDAGPIESPDFSAWDRWVADRYTERSVALAEMLKASGLTAPIPGLADMQGKGTFVDCQPYGTCWEPAPGQSEAAEVNAAEEDKPAAAGQRLGPQAAGTRANVAGRNIGFLGKPSAAGNPNQWTEALVMFPCVPGEVQAMLLRGAYPGVDPAQIYSNTLSFAPWSWAECHAGSWIYRGNRYMWVVGKRHHHPPVHWIKFGDKVAFVPIHPHDVKDRLPANYRNPVFAVDTKGHLIEKVEFPATHSVELLKDAPRALRNSYVPVLTRTEEPRMTAHALKEFTMAKNNAVKATPVPITFDHKTQTFMMAHQEMHGTRAVMVSTPMTNHGGTLQARAGGYSGSIGGGRSGGTGGGARSGGGTSSGSSGGFHGGGSTSSVSSVSSSSSTSTASAGANHH